MKIYIFLILCVLFWSGNFVIGRFVKEDITAFEIVFYIFDNISCIIFIVIFRNYTF